MALETARNAEGSIRRNLFTAVIIAAGLGFLLGVFTGR
jgi:ElaB/YqjD/DUF883 family membrane-anchored ribosome-binding protein